MVSYAHVGAERVLGTPSFLGNRRTTGQTTNDLITFHIMETQYR